MGKMDISMKLYGAAQVIDTFEAAKENLEGDVVYAVGTPLEYGIYQEIGTSFHAPQPYLRPAVNDAQGRLDGVIEQEDDLETAMEVLAKFVKGRAKTYAPVDTGDLQNSIDDRRID